MAVIIDRVMDYQTKAENNFADLGTAYYTDPILRVAQAGVMQGDGKNVRPKDKITCEEAVSMLARALSVTAGGSLTNFADNSRISSWAMANVAAFAENGYIAGRSGNRFEPKANITRAEVVKLLDNMISDYITESGTATPKGTGSHCQGIRRYAEQGQAEQHGRSRRQGRRSEGDRLRDHRQGR